MSIQFTESQLAKIEKQFAMFVPVEMKAGSDELFYLICEKLFTNLNPEENPSVRTITLAELASLDRNEVAVQNPINVAKVATLLSGEDNLMRVGLVNPVRIGLQEGKPYIEGGGHRTAALLEIFNHFGFGNQLHRVEVPCFVTKANSLNIILDNISRGATAYEKTLIHSSAEGVDVGSVESLYDAYLDDALSLSDAARLLTVAMTEQQNAGLTQETRGKVGVSFINAVKKAYGVHQFKLQDAFLGQLVEFINDNLQETVDYVSKTTTLIARAVNPMAGYLMSKFTAEVDAGRVVLSEKPVKVAKVKTARPKAAPQTEQVIGEIGETPAPTTTARKPRQPRKNKVVAEG